MFKSILKLLDGYRGGNGRSVMVGSCQCSEGGPIVEVTDELVNADDDDHLTPYMLSLSTEWLFTGTKCNHCGQHCGGTYVPCKRETAA